MISYDQLPLSIPRGEGFWREVILVNNERRKNRKRWLFERDIMPLHRKYPAMRAGDLMAYIEWTS